MHLPLTRLVSSPFTKKQTNARKITCLVYCCSLRMAAQIWSMGRKWNVLSKYLTKCKHYLKVGIGDSYIFKVTCGLASRKCAPLGQEHAFLGGSDRIVSYQFTPPSLKTSST
uniref:Uncharacterized protein n=1 Tax=Sphaerodactylus townsendi TaxID=933632 RepID=A0ACB8EV42_9SAUR